MFEEIFWISLQAIMIILMNENFTLDNILSQFSYSPDNPLLFSSGLFLFFFMFFSLGYSLINKRLNLRILYVIAFSLFFYYKTSGFYFLLLVALSLADFSIGYFIYNSDNNRIRKLLVAISAMINLSILCYFKYTNLIADLYNDLFSGNLDFGDVFLPIGVSFFTFQSMSYTIDIYRKNIAPLEKWIDYLFYLSFFPQLVAGPIVRARDFIPQITRNPIILSREELGRGVFLIACGLFKKAVISDYISINFVDRIFDAPLLYSGFENIMGVYGYALQIYCDFSGYSDMAIGIALLLGFQFKDNFNSPYKSATITEFWRRWHISLSSWLKDYLYISLGGNRKGRLRTYINLMITMLLGGLWHGAAWRFVIWGAIHGLSLTIHKFIMEKFTSFKKEGAHMSRGRRIIGIFITFNVVCFSWIFFRADSYAIAGDILSQIFTDFKGSIWLDFIIGYKNVMILFFWGYLVHFMSDKLYDNILKRFINAPIILYPISIAFVVWLVMQVRSGDVQPFIYFQF